MTKDELIDKYIVEKAECNVKYAEARRLKYRTDDPEAKKVYAADQEYYAVRKHAIEDFLRDLESLDIQKSLYTMRT